MKYWLVRYREQVVLNVIEVGLGTKPEPHIGYTVVEAETIDLAKTMAKRKVYNLYCAQKKKESKERHHTNQECACGRPFDRPNPAGGMFLTCLVCAARQVKYNVESNQRRASGIKGKKVRDETSRLVANAERRRERKQEMRIEVLVEVRKKFWDTTSVKEFATWLDESIESLM